MRAYAATPYIPMNKKVYYGPLCQIQNHWILNHGLILKLGLPFEIPYKCDSCEPF